MDLNNNIERVAAKKRKKQRADRLSSLPNDLIHKILSFISIKDTVKTMVLSSRYTYIWTTMPYLNFSTQDFPRLQKFAKFVNHFLYHRYSHIDVSSLKLSFRGKVTQGAVKKLMDYAFSHNIQQLDVECLLETSIEFPFSLFSSMSLKDLTLKGEVIETYQSRFGSHSKILRATSTLDLPALTTLCLQDVKLFSDSHTEKCVGFFSKCANLKNLTLRRCVIEGSSSFSICHHHGLENLTLDEGLRGVKVVNVVAPQLKNLIIRSGNDYRTDSEYVISAPHLTSLVYQGYYPLHLSTDGFHSLKEADICHLNSNISTYPYMPTKPHTKLADAHQIVRLLQQLRSVEFLTLSLELIELLSSSVELISHQPSPFVNLKHLTIYPKQLSESEMKGLPKRKINLSSEVKNYLLDSSPGAIFTMFSREEVIATMDVASAQKLMAKLRVLLEQTKPNTKTNRVNTNREKHNQGNAQAEMKTQVEIGGNIAVIKSCWKDLSVQFEKRKAKAHLIISMLESIEGLLKKLPATNQAMIQPGFSSLCDEAVIVMSKITDCMKIQCDENQNRLSVCFHERSTTLEPSL